MLTNTNKLLEEISEEFDYLSYEKQLKVMLEYHGGLDYFTDIFFDALHRDTSLSNLKYILKVIKDLQTNEKYSSKKAWTIV